MESISSLYVPDKLGITYLDVLHNLLQLHEVIIFDCTSDLPEMERVAKITTLEDARLYFDDYGPDQFYALMFIDPPPEVNTWIKHLPKHKYYWKMSREEYASFVERYPRLLATLENDPYCILPQLYISKYQIASKLFNSENHRHTVIKQSNCASSNSDIDATECTDKEIPSTTANQELPLIIEESSIIYVNVTHHNPEIGDYAFPLHDDYEEDLIAVIKSVEAVYDKEIVQGGKTMVIFCDKGQSRSGATVLYLVCRQCHVSLEEARAMVDCVYPLISPNPGFMQQLKHLLNEPIV